MDDFFANFVIKYEFYLHKSLSFVDPARTWPGFLNVGVEIRVKL